jgi:hypothetical protein
MEHSTPVSAPAPRSPVLVSGIPRRSFLFSRYSPVIGGHTALPSVLSRRAKQPCGLRQVEAAPYPDDGPVPPRNPAMSSG